MSKRTTKAITISLLPPMVEELNRMRRVPVADPQRGEAEAAQQGREAIERGEFVTLDEVLPRARGLAISGAGLHKRARARTKPKKSRG
jgi:hypothetical protein